jgi:hypothetical protein
MALGAPVFVLCNGRSGSTLLRFLLDAHPDLACPPETNLPAAAGQLARVWSLIEGAPVPPKDDDELPGIPDVAVAGVRRALDEITRSYLARRGKTKTRYCDKSLGSARFASLLLRIYPDARFLCLYRHPMDVIASGIEACPWGLSGFGYEPYAASMPGNSVGALARCWADSVQKILGAEEQFAGSCHRVRYEDLVADPEGTAAGIFEFLGVGQQPGISERCFSAEREGAGPSDYKIWHTSQVTSSSVGRGWSVPAAMIPPSVIQTIRELTDQLGYLPVDDAWGTASVPADLRASSAGRIEADARGDSTRWPGGEGIRQAASADDDTASALPVRPLPQAELIESALRAGLARTDKAFAGRWEPCSGESFALVATAPVDAGGTGSRWIVDLAAGTITTSLVLPGLAGDDGDSTAWDIVGEADAWQAVLSGSVNLGVAMRRCELRYCQSTESTSADARLRVGMLGELLSLRSGWRDRQEPAPEPATFAAG